MGDSLDQWRMRIGCHHQINCKLKNPKFTRTHHIPFARMTVSNYSLLTVLTIAIVMLIVHGDIELNPGPNNRSDNLATKEDISDLKKQMQDILDGINSLNSKWEAFEFRINELEDKIQKQDVTINENKQSICAINYDVEEYKETVNKLSETKKTIQNMQTRADEAEDRAKRNNLIFAGIEESDSESWYDTETKLIGFIKNTLLVTADITFERVHRIGKKGTTATPRLIVAMFSTFKDREQVKRSAHKLKGSNIYITEDFSKGTREIRKMLRQKKAELTDMVDKVQLNYKTLDVKDKQGSFYKYKYDIEVEEVLPL